MCYNILVQTTVVISIIAPLFIMMQVKQPEDFVGQMGDLIQFGIEARGEGLTYQWQLSGSNGTYWNDSSAVGCNTPQIYGFDITEARIGNLYRCKVTDSAGNVVYSEPAEIVLLSETWSFSYNADGLRTSRSNGATTYNYIYNGSSLSQMTVGGNTLYFAYDASGTPMSVTYNGTNYYYATNLQGDVAAILNTSGSAVVQYAYDAWGKLLSTTGSMAETLGEINPLRYRGYVYDIETGFYYLQSRYYDPGTGRFINADSFASTGQGFLGYNMFAYCNNNPVVASDPTGEAFFLVTAAIFAVGGAIVGGITASKKGGNVFTGIATGAVIGGVAGLGIGAAAGVMLAGSATASTVSVAVGTKALVSVASTSGAVAGGLMIADNITQAMRQAPQVFWSGGKTAMDAASSLAQTINGITLEMTRLGQHLEKLQFIRNAWEAASRNFANVASNVASEIHVVHNAAGLNIQCIWGKVEYPLLKLKELIYHVVN